MLASKVENNSEVALNNQKPAVNAARYLAAKVLEDVAVNNKYANLVLPGALREEQRTNRGFSFRDAAFTSELVYGTIRRQMTLDFALSKHSAKPLEDLDKSVLVSLRLGAYQILYLRVPEHAAVAETVEVARTLAGEGAAKFVNAVLRSLLREGKENIFARIDALGSGATRLSVEHSHPQWIVESYANALKARGLPEEDLEAALAANNEAAAVTLVARPGLIEPKDLAKDAETILDTTTSQGLLSEYAVIIASGDPGALPPIRDGRAAVQDEGSQFAAIVLSETPLEGSDSNWLDLCAGPGGKSALLAAIGSDRGVTVTANEINPRRARLVERSARALSNVTVVNEDGTTFSPGHSFDRVLVDSPCLGLGSLRRRPESRWRHLQTDLDDLVPLQQKLLDQGIALARSGGVIAWVTCSPHTDETIAQVERVLKSKPVELLDGAALAQTLVPVDLDLGGGGDVAAKTIQLWPHKHGTDAMFIALMRKL